MKGIDVKKGSVIVYDGKIIKITSTRHTKPGKGPAYVQAEGFCMSNKGKVNIRLRTSESIETVYLTQFECTFSHKSGEDSYYFIDQSNFEQIEISTDKIDFDISILNDETIYIAEADESGEIISLKAPKSVIMVVKSAQAYKKGQTLTKTYKPLELECGAIISGPVHIKDGDKIVIDSETLEYLRKA